MVDGHGVEASQVDLDAVLQSGEGRREAMATSRRKKGDLEGCSKLNLDVIMSHPGQNERIFLFAACT